MKGKEQVLVGVLGAADGHQPATHSTLGVQNREVLSVMTVMDAEISGAVGHLQCLVGQRPTDEGRIWTGDGEFLPGNGGHILAEVLGVLDPDAGQDAHLGIHDVGGVETPTRPTSSTAALTA